MSYVCCVMYDVDNVRCVYYDVCVCVMCVMCSMYDV